MKFEKEITGIHRRCLGEEDYMGAFIFEYRDFISPRISDYFFRLNDWEHDLWHLYKFVEGNHLPESDWILFVADYSRLALSEDTGSIQARDSLETYMKLHGN